MTLRPRLWIKTSFFSILFSLFHGGSSNTINGTTNGHVTLQPKVTGRIDEILWKHKGNKMVEWDRTTADPIEYLTFKGRTKLDIETGDVTIVKLTKDDSGEYEAEVVIGTALRSIKYKVEVIEITCTNSDCITRSNGEAEEKAATTGNHHIIIGSLCGILGVGVAVVGVFFCYKRKTKGQDASTPITEETKGLTSAGNEEDLLGSPDRACHHAGSPSINSNIDNSPCDYNETKAKWEAKVMPTDNKKGPPKKQTSVSKNQRLQDTEESFIHDYEEKSAGNEEEDAGPCSTDEIQQQNNFSSDCPKKPGDPNDGLSVPGLILSSGVSTISPDGEETQSTQDPQATLKGSTAASNDEEELETESSSGNQHVPDNEAKPAAASSDEKEDNPEVISCTNGAHQHTGFPSESSTPPIDNEDALSVSRQNQSDDSSGDQNSSHTEATPCIEMLSTGQDANAHITEETEGLTSAENKDAGPCSTDEIHKQNDFSSDCSKQPESPNDGLTVPGLILSSGVTPSTQDPHAALKGSTAASNDDEELQTEQSSGNQNVPDTKTKPAAASNDEEEEDPRVISCTDGARPHTGSPSINMNIDSSSFDYNETKGMWETKVMATDNKQGTEGKHRIDVKHPTFKEEEEDPGLSSSTDGAHQHTGSPSESFIPPIDNKDALSVSRLNQSDDSSGDQNSRKN